MTAFKSVFLNILESRGFIHQCSDLEGLDALAAKGQATAYVGYDCTAPSLHIGNFLTMMMLHWLQESGNKPITLMGGGTTMVGDPSGKDETRAIRSVEEIEANKASIRGVFAKVLRYGDGASDAIMLDNAEECSPYDFWQCWRNVEDADVGKFLKLFTILPLDVIAKLSALKGAEINEAKKALADAATSLLHGADAARIAADTARQTFEEG